MNLCALGGFIPGTSGVWNDQLFTYNPANGALTTRSGISLSITVGGLTHRAWSLRAPVPLGPPAGPNFEDITSESTTCIIQSDTDNRVLNYAGAAPTGAVLSTFLGAAGSRLWTKGRNILMKPIVIPGITPGIFPLGATVLATNQLQYFTLADSAGLYLTVGAGAVGAGPTITRTARNSCTPSEQGAGPTAPAAACTLGAPGAGPDWQRACPAPAE